MLLVFPLWTGFDGYSNITRPKFLFFAALTGIWLAALVVCALICRYRPSRPGLFRIFVLAFMAAACISAAFSDSGAFTIVGSSRYDGLVTLLLYGCIGLGVSRWGEFKERYVNLTAVASGLCCLVCILQLLRVNVLGLFPQGLDFYDAGTKYSGEFLGTIGNTNVLSAYFCLAIPLLAVSSLRAKPLRRALLLLPCLGCISVLVIIRAESGLVGCLGCLLVVVPYYVNYIGRRKLALRLLAAEAAIAAAALALVFFFPPSGGTLWELSELLHGRVEDSFGSSRIAIWREGLRLFAEAPVIGGGPDTFGLRSELNFSRFVAETGATLSTHADNAHCEPLGILVNLGILGFCAYCAVVFSSLRRWFRGSAPAVGAALLCYLVQSLFGLGLCIVVPIVWIYMGLISSDAGVKRLAA